MAIQFGSAMPNTPSGADPRGAGPLFCSQCGRPVVVADASFCKECGAPLSSEHWLRRDIRWNPWLAASLSIIPGVGHLYRGQPWRAIVWFLLVTVGYGIDQSLGALLHAVCALNAALRGAFNDAAVSQALYRRRLRARRGLRALP